MILNNDSTTVTAVGGVQENQIRIDPRNLDHIVSILSTNLYSHPEASFLREIVCNAVDSHTEADTKEPVILSITELNNEYTITIRDYGTGLSPERFQEIYLCIGSSTKRLSNNYIGSFGIGRFSSLACADIVHITSFYNGKAYYYLMMKNGSKINIDEVSVTDTEEKNGLEVRIVVNRIGNYLNALNYLTYIPNLYLHSNIQDERISDFNSRKTTLFDNFALGFYDKSSYGDPYLLLGNVLYQYDNTKLIKYNGYGYRAFLKRFELKFDIGELDITPNREAILYSQKTISAIEDKIKSAISEFQQIALQQQKDLDDIMLLYMLESSDKYLKVEKDEVSEKIKVEEIDEISTILSYSYKGLRIEKGGRMFNALRQFMLSSVEAMPFIGIIQKGTFLTTYAKKKLDLRELFFGNKRTIGIPEVKVIVLPNRNGVQSCYFKQYLSSKYGHYDTVIIVEKPNTSINNIRNLAFRGDLPLCVSDVQTWQTNKAATVWLYHQIVLSFGKYAEEIDVINSPEFIQFKEENKIKRDTSQKFPNDIRFYITTPHKEKYCSYWDEYHYKKDFSSTLRVDKWIKSMGCKQTVIYGCVDNPLFDLFKDIKNNQHNYVLVKVAKTNLKYLKNVPNDWKPIEDVINIHTPEIIKAITYNQFKFRPFEKDYEIVTSFLKYIPVEDSKELSNIMNYKLHLRTESIEPLNKLVQEFSKNKIPYDSSIIKMLDTFKKYIDIAKKLRNLYDLSTTADYLFAYMAMKMKLLRLNNYSYQHIREKLKPVENENN